MKKILKFMIKYKFTYIIALLCLVASIVLNLVSPTIMQMIIDDVLVGKKYKMIYILIAALLVVAIVKAICEYFKEYLMDVVSAKVAADLREDAYSHIQGLSMDYFNQASVGELMARLKEDIDNIWNGVGYCGMMAVQIVIHSVATMVCLVRLDYLLAIVPVVVMVMLAVVALKMEKELDKVYGSISEENAKLTVVAEQNLTGVRTVKAFAREEYEIEKFEAHNRKYYESNIKQSKVWAKYNPIFQLSGKLLPVVMVVLGGVRVVRGSLTIGSLVAIVEYSRKIVSPMEMLGWISNELSSSIAAFKKIDRLYKEESSVVEEKDAVDLSEVKGNIKFEHVSFIVDGKKILEDVSFDLKAGKTLGIMGATGSGKSTIINLLLRFYDVTKGKVKIDGVDVRKLKISQVRDAVAPVSQDVFLFSDTIKSNLRLGSKLTMQDSVIEQSVDDACARGFVDKLTLKDETVIGEKGVGLSGGQKQRLSIARALAKKASVLVLDDSTSALDMETEYKIQKVLEKKKDKTKIIIAHRISAVSKADEIIFLDKGRVVERGTHNELMRKKGMYYRTYIAQYGGHVIA